MLDKDLFLTDPRVYALQLIEVRAILTSSLLLCALNYMSHDDVRNMLDANELSPRFDETEED